MGFWNMPSSLVIATAPGGICVVIFLAVLPVGLSLSLFNRFFFFKALQLIKKIFGEIFGLPLARLRQLQARAALPSATSADCILGAICTTAWARPVLDSAHAGHGPLHLPLKSGSGWSQKQVVAASFFFSDAHRWEYDFQTVLLKTNTTRTKLLLYLYSFRRYGHLSLLTNFVTAAMALIPYTVHQT